MGVAEKQFWLKTPVNKGIEPVFRTSTQARVSITQIRTAKGYAHEVEQSLLALAHEFWQSGHLNDIKIMQSQTENEFLIISSWQPAAFMGDSKIEMEMSVRHKLSALIADGIINSFEDKTDNYSIIE